MTIYAAPGTHDSLITFKSRYEHWIYYYFIFPKN